MISNNPPQSPGSSLSIPGPTLTRPSPTPSSGSALTNLGRPTLTVDPTDTSVSPDPTIHGDKVLQKWATDLPFLCKVLSVQKAVSIQAHPDKEMARVLHKLHPGVYRDDNHKPEVALALTEFEALCGFISLKELKDMLSSVPEIAELVGVADAERILLVGERHENGKVDTDLEAMLSKLMLSSKDTISK